MHFQIGHRSDVFALFFAFYAFENLDEDDAETWADDHTYDDQINVLLIGSAARRDVNDTGLGRGFVCRFINGLNLASCMITIGLVGRCCEGISDCLPLFLRLLQLLLFQLVRIFQ